MAKTVQNLQLLYKTMIVFFPKSFAVADLESSASQISCCFDVITNSIDEILSFKEVFNLELGYSASVVFTMLSTFKTKETLRIIVN